MDELLSSFLNKNRSKRLNIHCVGDAMVDEYYDVKVNRISPEFPMPIMWSTHNRPISRPGGAANVAYQFKHFNVAPTLICLPDTYAEQIFKDHGLYRWSNYFENEFSHLPIKRRFLDNGIQVTRHDIENHLCGLKPESLDNILQNMASAISKNGMCPEVVIMSDYDKGFFSSQTINPISFYKSSKTIVDPKFGPISKWKGCSVFKPNCKEALDLSGLKDWKDQARYFQQELECDNVAITFGGDQVAGLANGDLFCFKPDKRVEVESVIGAGDCFCAFFAMAIGHGFSVPEAAEIAWNSGCIYVQRRMNRPVTPAELSPTGFVTPDDLQHRDFKLVFTNGCFDLLHHGHIQTLKFAKTKGEKLVVALNSDESVKRLKGESRPVLPLAQRMEIMSNIKSVDFVVSFDEDTPLEVIKKIKPDVLVKGADYIPGDIVGADIVKEVYRAPIVSGVSTSCLINKLL